MKRAREEDPCWLVGTNPEGHSEVIEGRLVGKPVDGLQVVRVSFGCGILHTIPVEKVYLTRAEAEKRLAELEF